MRLYSTPESAKILEVSLLAIIESIAAVSFSLWLAISYIGTWNHVLIGASIAPFLLLKTQYSRRYAFYLFYKYERYSEKFNTNRFLSSNYYNLLAFSTPLILVLIRIWSLIVSVITHPLKSISLIPTNWTRINICTDSFHPPELFDGMETSNPKTPLNRLIFSRYIENTFLSITNDFQNDLRKKLRLNESFIFKLYYHFIYYFWVIFAFALCVLLALIIYSPAFIYRLSLKSTSIVWLPLLWIIPKATPKTKLLTRLTLINKSSWGRFVIVVSALVIILFLSKIFLSTMSNEFIEWSSKFFIYSKLSPFIEPDSIPIWQVASFLNSFISIFIFFYADNKLVQFKTGELNEDDDHKIIECILRTTNVIGAALSLYTISCLLYVVCYKTTFFEWPPLGDKLFPWG